MGKWNIHYHLDGGIQSVNNPNILTNVHADCVISPAEKQGYTFEGWYLDAALTEPLENQTIVSSELTEDIDLYAKYRADSYTITYDMKDENMHRIIRIPIQ